MSADHSPVHSGAGREGGREGGRREEGGDNILRSEVKLQSASMSARDPMVRRQEGSSLMISNITISSGTDGPTTIILTFEHRPIRATMGLGKPYESWWGVGE